MECFICLELKQDIVDCIKMKSPTWDELQVQSVVEKHLWAMVMFKSKSQWLCLTCWHILQEFHKFYMCIENAQINNECIIKNELDSLPETKCNILKSVYFVENILDQTTRDFVKDEISIYDNDYDDDIPFIDGQNCVDTSLEDPIDEESRQENENGVPGVNSDLDILEMPKDNERKSCLKYFYQSPISCRDFDKFITEHFNLICSNCEQSFDTFSELKSHYHEIHNKRGYVVCCETTFYNRALLVDHINCHLNPNYFKCEFCSKVLKLRKTFNSHMRKHEKPPHSSDICNKKFKGKCSLKYHKQTHVLAEDKKIPCTECDKLFPNKYLLSTHLELVHVKKYARQCDICGQSLPNLGALTRHMQKHEGAETSVSCDTCGLLVSSKNHLNIHMKFKHPVEGYRDHVCHICQRESLTANALRNHMRRNHQTGYVYKCTMCEKAFKRLDHLKIHLNIHTGKNLSKCSWCPRSFRAISSLRRHRERRHPKEWEEARRKTYYASLSSNDFSSSPSKDKGD